ncbi:uncharacterized protein LOC116432827 isoform X1 [Nomia melanderi]|uniref:uncharacterized protein LOC116432827 isoform X1 n=2 Tax=Nomia melanderi TaxID=2448451 RepID=UPI003FCDFA58
MNTQERRTDSISGKMSMSTKEVLPDKPIQEIRVDLKQTVPSGKLKSPTSNCFECKLDKESKETKVKTEEKEQSQSQSTTCPKVEKPKIEAVKPKATEAEKSKRKIEETMVKKVTEVVSTNQSKPAKCKMTPIVGHSDEQKPTNVAVPRKYPPLSKPLLNVRPIVLATHLVPSLPIGLFEVLAEAIEVATEKPVALMYEPRSHRPVAKDVVDIAILPANEEWEDGELLPASFSFKHHLNKNNSPCVYADVIVASDRAAHVEDIIDLRGHRCALPDRKKKIGAAALIFNYLYTRGENPTFFGNTLDADTQVAALQMVAGKQAEVGIIESPVIKCQKNLLPGIDSVQILTSLGPLPPYRIMVKRTLSDDLTKKITTYLLNVHQDKEWVDKFASFGITNFAKNSMEFYDQTDVKSVVTSVPYY